MRPLALSSYQSQQVQLMKKLLIIFFFFFIFLNNFLVQGSDMDLCLSSYGFCNYVSGKHATIFFDKVCCCFLIHCIFMVHYCKESIFKTKQLNCQIFRHFFMEISSLLFIYILFLERSSSHILFFFSFFFVVHQISEENFTNIQVFFLL